jgi:hypothetical protein
MLSRRYWSGGIVFLLFSIFYVVCFISWMYVYSSTRLVGYLLTMNAVHAFPSPY